MVLYKRHRRPIDFIASPVSKNRVRPMFGVTKSSLVLSTITMIVVDCDTLEGEKRQSTYNECGCRTIKRNTKSCRDRPWYDIKPSALEPRCATHIDLLLRAHSLWQPCIRCKRRKHWNQMRSNEFHAHIHCNIYIHTSHHITSHSTNSAIATRYRENVRKRAPNVRSEINEIQSTQIQKLLFSKLDSVLAKHSTKKGTIFIVVCLVESNAVGFVLSVINSLTFTVFHWLRISRESGFMYICACSRLLRTSRSWCSCVVCNFFASNSFIRVLIYSSFHCGIFPSS